MTNDLKLASAALNTSLRPPQVQQQSGGWFSGQSPPSTPPPSDITATAAVHIASLSKDLELHSWKILDRVVQAFAHLDLMTSESTRLTTTIQSKKAKRFASELEEEKNSGPLPGKIGACGCRTDPICGRNHRCPCAKAGVECTKVCRCGKNCESTFRDWSNVDM